MFIPIRRRLVPRACLTSNMPSSLLSSVWPRKQIHSPIRCKFRWIESSSSTNRCLRSENEFIQRQASASDRYSTGVEYLLLRTLRTGTTMPSFSDQFSLALPYERYLAVGTEEQQRRWMQVYDIALLDAAQE